MKTLSLCQPWASLLFENKNDGTGKVKSWETRSWRPKSQNHRIIMNEGMLIHASATWKREQKELITEKPFVYYMGKIQPMPMGAIIGWVKIHRILTSEQFLAEQPKIMCGQPFPWDSEIWFGDYSKNRFAWEVVEAIKFTEPILNIKGSLNLWDYELSLLEMAEIPN